jgi:hypothetical protein
MQGMADALGLNKQLLCDKGGKTGPLGPVVWFRSQRFYCQLCDLEWLNGTF